MGVESVDFKIGPEKQGDKEGNPDVFLTRFLVRFLARVFWPQKKKYTGLPGMNFTWK